MNAPEMQWRNNDPSENIQVEFTAGDGGRRVLSFVATRPHWCAEPTIYGDLFAAPLQQVLDGEVDPIPLGSSQEAELLSLLRGAVLSAVRDVDRCRQILARQLHVGRMDAEATKELSWVWLLDALESRSKRHAQMYPHPRA